MGKGRAAAHDFDPAAYKVVGHIYLGDSQAMASAYAGDHADLQRKLGSDTLDALYAGAGKCHSCGTLYLHGAVVDGPHGLETVGGICAVEYFGIGTVSRLRQKEARKISEREAKKTQGDAFLADHLADVAGLIELLDSDEETKRLAGNKAIYALSVWTDMFESARQWGSLSDRQVAFARKLVTEVHEAVESARNAPPVVSIPESYLTGRVEITGTIISTKTVESMYGLQFKMLVEVATDDGTFRLWGTQPAAISHTDAGDEIRFTAAVEQSRDDETFGFFSRPAKATTLEREDA